LSEAALLLKKSKKKWNDINKAKWIDLDAGLLKRLQAQNLVVSL